MAEERSPFDWCKPEEVGSTSSSLLGQVQTGHAEAWNRLVGLYGPTVYRWCRQQGIAAEDAVDVCQDVFLSVASCIAHFRYEKPSDSFRGWLWTITRSKALDHFRRRSGQPKAVGGSDNNGFLAGLPAAAISDSSEFLADNSLLQRALELVRKDAEPASWQAFWRMVVEGHSSTEVARDLGLTPSAVRQAKYRLLRRLRQELGG